MLYRDYTTLTMLGVESRVPALALFIPPQRNAAKVLVKRAGTWHDITHYVAEGAVRYNNDNPVNTLDLRLYNGNEYPSLAPRVKISPANHVNGQYMPLLDRYNEIVVQAAMSRDGTTPDAWITMFGGYLGDQITTESDASGVTLSLQVRDYAKQLMDDYILYEEDLVYENMYASQIIQALLTRRYQEGHLPNHIQLRVIGSDDYWIEHIRINKGSTWDVIQSFPEQSNKDVRFMLDETTGEVRLTYWTPSLTMTPGWKVSAKDILRESLDTSDAGNRYKITLKWRDGNGELQTTTLEDQTHRKPNEPLREMMIEEEHTSYIKDEDAALRFATAVLSATKSESATTRLQIPFSPYMRLHDVIEITNEDVRSEPELYAIEDLQFRFTPHEWWTDIVASETVKLRPNYWLSLESRRGVSEPIPAEAVVGPDGKLTDDLARRPVGMLEETVVEARFAELPTVGSNTLKAELTLDGQPVDFTALLEGIDEPYLKVVHNNPVVSYTHEIFPLGADGFSPRAACYGPHGFVAVGVLDSQVGIGISPDGSEWTVFSPSDSDYITLRGVTYGPAGYVAVGHYGPGVSAFAVSQDGETWTVYLGQDDESLGDIAHGPAGYIAVGYDYAGARSLALISQDGITWEYLDIDPSDIGLTSIEYGGPAGYVAATGSGAIWTSPNGYNWAKRDSGTDEPIYELHWTGTEYIGVCDYGLLVTSQDGITWTLRDSGTYGTLYNVTALRGRRFIGGLGEVLYSDDAEVWHPIPDVPGGGGYAAVAVSDSVAILMNIWNNRVVRITAHVQYVTQTHAVGKVVDHTVHTITLDRPWTENNVPKRMDDDWFSLTHYMPVTQAQLALARKDPDGFAQFDAGRALFGRVLVTEDLMIENQDGSMRIVPKGIEMIGNDGTTEWSPAGLVFRTPTGETRGYLRGLQMGVNAHGDHVPLNFTRRPQVFLQPYDMMFYDPTTPGIQRVELRADEVEPTGFRVHAAIVSETTGDITHSIPKTTYRPSSVYGYCSGQHNHSTYIHNALQIGNVSLYDVGGTLTYTTEGDKVRRIALNLYEMGHCHAYARSAPWGDRRARNELEYVIRLYSGTTPTGTPVATLGPFRWGQSAVAESTPVFASEHYPVTRVFEDLPEDRYTFQIEILDKIIDTANGNNTNKYCWIVLDSWEESGGSIITPVRQMRVQWFAVESDGA